MKRVIVSLSVLALLCGAAAPEVADRFTPYGMVLEIIDGDVGSAAAAASSSLTSSASWR